jgi:hypothetical protein
MIQNLSLRSHSVCVGEARMFVLRQRSAYDVASFHGVVRNDNYALFYLEYSNMKLHSPFEKGRNPVSIRDTSKIVMLILRGTWFLRIY